MLPYRAGPTSTVPRLRSVARARPRARWRRQQGRRFGDAPRQPPGCVLRGTLPKRVRRFERSVFGQIGEVALGRLVPTHPRDRVPPPGLHGLERTRVRLVAARDDFFEMAILGLDDG